MRRVSEEQSEYEFRAVVLFLALRYLRLREKIGAPDRPVEPVLHRAFHTFAPEYRRHIKKICEYTAVVDTNVTPAMVTEALHYAHAINRAFGTAEKEAGRK